MPALLDITGQRFNKLTVLHRAERVCGKTRWTCQCDCGGMCDVFTMHLRAGHTKSCGCIPRQNSDRVLNEDGELVRPPGYWSWKSMQSRCRCEGDPAYADYGGRGITICERWLGKGGLANFLKDMGPKPTPTHSIGLTDPNGNYCPENCRWEDSYQQAVAKRGVRLVTYNGKSQSVMAWCRELGLAIGGVHDRLRKGWSTDRAFSTPRRGGGRQSERKFPTAVIDQKGRINHAPEWELTP